VKSYKLGDVCDLSKGKTITRATASEGEIPVIGGGLGPTYYNDVANRKPPVITVSASGANAGFVNYWNIPIWASDCTTIVEKPNSPASIDYIYKYLLSRQEYINTELRRGSAQPHVYTSDIAEIKIPVPSLDQQREIVKKLDSAFAEIDLLEENLISREGLLELLLQGALSVPYKSAIENNVNSMRLGEIADFQGGSQPAKSNFLYKEQKGYVRFIQIRDFSSDRNLTYIPISTKNRLCTKSDILIGRYGASVGKILTGLEGAYNVALMKVIPKNDIVDRDYLYFYLLSEIFQTNLLNVSDRSAQNGFSKDDISGFPVIIPSLREQKRIVAKLAKVRNDILEINLVQLKTKTELALLRQSLLSNAFTLEEEVA
jgi:restriction endonuclease S subunit